MPVGSYGRDNVETANWVVFSTRIADVIRFRSFLIPVHLLYHRQETPEGHYACSRDHVHNQTGQKQTSRHAVISLQS